MRVFLATLCGLVFLTPALGFGQIAHVPSYLFNGDSAGDEFGISVSGAGDVNGDGFGDLIVGAYSDGNNGSLSGSARVFSGFDGAILYTKNGDAANARFGVSVGGVGDLNSDGFDDFIVGAYGDSGGGAGAGNARVFSGADGSILFSLNGDSSGDRFGLSVSGAGDVNSDGTPDFIVGADRDGATVSSSGSAFVFSGETGTVLYAVYGISVNGGFGQFVSGAGDVNNDGFDDFIVGAWEPTIFGKGYARVFSGVNGAVLYHWIGDSAGDRFGTSVGGAGDVNNDGFDDLIVGAENDDNNGSNSGSIRVFSGFDGSMLYHFDGAASGDSFGYPVSGTGDVNGDGHDDFLAASFDRGYVRVYSGATGAVLFSLGGDSPSDAFGISARAAGDVNDDGVPDIIVGASLDDNNGAESGSARVFISVITPPPHCPGNANYDSIVDFNDINAVIANWLADYTPGTGEGDADNNSIVNFDDINAVIANWLNTCP